MSFWRVLNTEVGLKAQIAAFVQKATHTVAAERSGLNLDSAIQLSRLLKYWSTKLLSLPA